MELIIDFQGISKRRMQALESLVDFLRDATAELMWLSEKEETEISRDWSAKGLNPSELEKYYEVCMSGSVMFVNPCFKLRLPVCSYSGVSPRMK